MRRYGCGSVVIVWSSIFLVPLFLFATVKIWTSGWFWLFVGIIFFGGITFLLHKWWRESQ